MSTTGIQEMSTSKLRQALIPLDNQCPKCYCKMEIVQSYERGMKINTCYLCGNCGFKAPVYHKEMKDDKTMPLNDNQLNDFIKSFGK